MKKLLLFVFACGIIADANCATATIDGVTWAYTIENDHVRIGGGTSSERAVPKSTTGEITIPSSVDGRPVTSIADYAFEGCVGLTLVIIPDGVTEIGRGAFMLCNGLTTAKIPASVMSIGRDAFWGCSGLSSVTILNGVSVIGESAFSGCRGLTSMTVPDSVTAIGEAAFCGCDGLVHMTLPFVGWRRGITETGWLIDGPNADRSSPQP